MQLTRIACSAEPSTAAGIGNPNTASATFALVCELDTIAGIATERHMADGAEAQPSDKKEHKHRHKEHKHKERDREKDRHRDRERTKEHGKDRKEDRERHRSSRGDREHKRERSDRDRGSEEARASKRQDRRDSLEANEVDVERHIHAVKDAPEAQVTDMGMGETAPSDSGAVADPSPELAAIKPQVQESGGEVSMSIEETNR